MAFYGKRMAGDNKWIHSPIFYNPTILRRRGPTKKGHSSLDMLHPNHGWPKKINRKIDINSIFNNNRLITTDKFQQWFTIKINLLNFQTLKFTKETTLRMQTALGWRKLCNQWTPIGCIQ
jgi:hypothetical protein